MIDVQALEAQMTKAVREAVATEVGKAQGLTAKTELVKTILQKPVMIFPDDIQLVLGIGRSTAFNLAKDDASFPMMSKVGARSILRTDRFMEWLEGKAT
ncbi:hypothetical protein [Tateyamaria pelophila]|uniref:hypothetical protein n=1 Tax=Tateyamaria pelophila TaxID=328415 RepID=UPI001CBB75F0|nr:hypothetical protein [Tateyamaria pelophila]